MFLNMSAIVPTDAIVIGFGAFCGALTRYQCGQVAAEWIAKDPKLRGHLHGWHTALINVGGSFLLGAISGTPLINPKPTLHDAPINFFGLTPKAKLMLGVGFCGSFTTFSTYSVDIVGWLAQGKTTKALSYIMINNFGGIVAAGLGFTLVKKILR